MKTPRYIRIEDFCAGHALEASFVFELEELELIRVVTDGPHRAIHRKDLRRLERLVRLHRDLEINPHGLQAVDHLLGQVEALREEIRVLRNRLGQWETP